MRKYFTEIGYSVLNKTDRPGLEAEVFLSQETELNLEMDGVQVESLVQAQDLGIALRLLQDGRTGFSYSNDLSAQGLDRLITRAQTALRYARANPYAAFPHPVSEYPNLSLFDPAIAASGQDEKTELLIKAGAAALELDAEMEKIETAGYIEQHLERMILNSHSLVAYEKANGCGIYLSAHAGGEDKRSSGSSSLYRKRIQELEPGKVGEEAGRHALYDLHAKSMPSGNFSGIFEPRIAAKFLSLLSGAFSLEQVSKGKSLLHNQMGKSIAPALFTLYDDGQDMRGNTCGAFDGEGSPTRKTWLVEQGILSAYLCDTVWGNTAGRPSTGNSHRSVYSSLPGIGIRQLILSPGETTPQAMISGIDDGLLITEVMGMHTANAITGEFSLGASGVRIRAGQLSHGVKSITIAGSLTELLQNLEALGNDLTFYGNIASPSWLIQKLSIGGKD